MTRIYLGILFLLLTLCPFRQSAAQSIFSSFQIDSNTAITGTGNTYQQIAGTGLIQTFANPSGSIFTNTLALGNIPNSALQNSSATVNGMACTLGASCAPSLPACADASGSGTAQSCNTSPTFTPNGTTNSCIQYTTMTTNTGALTLTVNGQSPGKSVVKWLGTGLAAGDMPANKSQVLCYDGTNWNAMTIGNAPANSSALSSITGATSSHTVTNGNNPQTWQWAETSNNQAAFTFGESSAATNGTLTNGVSNQSILAPTTLAGSTAAPFSVTQGTLSGASNVPALQIQTTWNNNATNFEGLVFQLASTASGAGSNFLDFYQGSTSEMHVRKDGLVYAQVFSANSSSPSFEGSGASINTSLQGGNDLSQNASSGGTTLRGADNANTGTSTAGGYAILRGGELTAVAPSASALEGVVQVGSGFLKGTAVAAVGDVVCGTTTAFTVTDCTTTPQVNIIGIATSTSNPIGVVTEGQALVKLDNASTIGHTVCMGTATAGQAHDSLGQGACNTPGASIGVVIANSGTVTTMSGSTTAATAMTNTAPALVLVQLHIGK